MRSVLVVAKFKFTNVFRDVRGTVNFEIITIGSVDTEITNSLDDVYSKVAKLILYTTLSEVLCILYYTIKGIFFPMVINLLLLVTGSPQVMLTSSLFSY